MSVSYMVREEFNAQSAIWAVASGIYRSGVFVGKAYQVVTKLAFLMWCTVEMIAAWLWKGKPSAATLVMVAKALALSALPVVGMALVFMAPMAVVCVGIIVAFAVVTKPRAK